MNSSISYSELSWEDISHRRSSLSSVKLIPDGVVKRTLLFFALIAGTTITFFYMRHSTGYNVSDYLQGFRSENAMTSNEASIMDEHVKAFTPFMNESSKTSWTWTCPETGSSCVRVMASQSTGLQSLKTCNMRCTKIPIWPQPTGPSTFSTTVVPVELRSLTLNIVKSPSKEVTKYLEEAFAFIKADIHKDGFMKHDIETTSMDDRNNALGLLVKVTVDGDPDPRLRLDTKEDYTLEMKQEEKILVVNILAHSFCGARHGFETLTQLVWCDPYHETALALQSASIVDAPKFHYRGLLLDTARQYFPVEDIIRTIDAMAANKLNTFHWHAVDSQSFPLKLDSVPQMALYGAYSLKQVYTREDIKAIVHRARVRGIRVVLEIDSPAHVGRAWSWGNSSGLGELAYCVETSPWRGMCGEPPCGQLNPHNEHVFEILENIYREVLELTGVDDVYHLGGDEVKALCWQKHLENEFIMDVWYEFTQKVTLALQKANKGKLPELTIIWSSQLTNALSRVSNYTIQLWRGSQDKEMQAIPEAGIRTIVSHIDAWYLDCGFDQWIPSFSGACQPYRQWPVVYEHRPWEGHSDWKVQGGTACMWTEELAPEGVDARVWPRGAALGERLWSDPAHKVTNDVYVRLDMQRGRLVERGIRADPIWPRWCTDNPYKCLRQPV